MALTSIDAIYLNRDDFSRYEDSHHTIKARALFSGHTGGETLRATLYREGGWQIAQKEIALTADPYAKGHIFEFDLRGSDLMYAPDDARPDKKFFWGRHGRYYITVEEPSGVSLDSAEFYISPLTVDLMKDTALYGMTLAAAEIKFPIEQPKQITGVTIVNCSDFIRKGVHKLIYTASGNTLRLDSSLHDDSDSVAIPLTAGTRRYTLVDDTVASGEEWLILDVDFYELPAGDVTENIVIDDKKIPDEVLRYYMNLAYDDIWADLGIPIEPTVLASEADATLEHHRIVDPVAFEHRKLGTYQSLKLPHRQLHHVFYLKGMMNDGEVITIPDEWRIEYAKNGQIELVPRNATMVAYVTSGLGLWSMALRRIPAFWHFRILAGFPEMENKYGVILEALYKRAAIDIMIKAGSAYRAGFSSETVSRDGISASVAYTSSAMYGVYSADIEAYKQWFDDQWKRYKRKLQGFRAVIL